MNNQPRFSHGSGKTYQLGVVERRTLQEGNAYCFATEVLKAYPEFCEDQGFTDEDAVNSYKAYVDFNDGLYTFYGRDSKGTYTKYFFSTEMKMVGAKQ